MNRILFCCILFLIINNGCKDNSVGPNAIPTLIGTWNWIQSSGGIGGATLTPANQHYTIKITFTSDSVYKGYKNDTLFTSASFTVRKQTYSSGNTSEIISYSPVVATSQIISRLDIDTLILSDMGADGFVSTFNRIK